MDREKLRRARKAAGLTQAQLAEALSVHPFTVSRWELGKQDPDDVKGIALKLNVPLLYLYSDAEIQAKREELAEIIS